jgi:TRAP-type mannitol/chloroaromatic compound transport system permease small subunit
MDLLLRFSKLVDKINDGWGWLADWMVLLSCLISAGNASVRYLLNTSSNGWLEIQWYMFSVIFLLGAAQTLRVNEHVRVDIFYGIAPPRARLWIDTLGIAFFMLPATLLLMYMSWPFFVASFPYEGSPNAGGLIRWPVKLLMPLGFFFLTLQGLSELIKRIAALTGRIDLDTHYEKPLQ